MLKVCSNRQRKTVRSKSHYDQFVLSDSSSDPDKLIPRSGKDERYDEVLEEIKSLEKELETELKKFERTLGFVERTRWHHILITDIGSNSDIGTVLLVTR